MLFSCANCLREFKRKPYNAKLAKVLCCSRECRWDYIKAHPGCMKGGNRFKRKEPNRFEIQGLVVRVWIDSKKFGTVSFVVDQEDWERFEMSQYRFYCVNGYAAYCTGRKQRKVHSLILPPLCGFEVDHINRNKMDNTRSNLRHTRKLNNNLNKGIISTNKSGVTGVRWVKKHNKWEGFLFLKGKNYHREFAEFEDAVAYRKRMESEHFAPFLLQG